MLEVRAQLLNLIELVLGTLNVNYVELARLSAVQQRLLFAVLFLIAIVLSECLEVLPICSLHMIERTNTSSSLLKLLQLIVQATGPAVIRPVPLHSRIVVASHETVNARLILTDASGNAASTDSPATLQRECKRTLFSAVHGTTQVVCEAPVGTGSEATAAHVVAWLITLSCEPALDATQVFLQLARLRCL